MRRDNGNHEISGSPDEVPKYAFIGIRACEIEALRVHDEVLLRSNYGDADYAARRRDNFIVAVNCSDPASTCFCESMNTGPVAKNGFDLSLTEVCDTDEHFFVVTVGTERGAAVLSEVPSDSLTPEHDIKAKEVLLKAVEKIERTIDMSDVKELLYRNAESPHWEQDVGKRCLNCTNCTMVCPTCFCTNVIDTANLSLTEAVRTRQWDSCFNEDYSYIHGGSVRVSSGSRYRQWLTHKLGSWQDQFGMPGCVGCGRCITWCPVGIDLTEEIEDLRQRDAIRNKEMTVKE
jgi:ferredoxin